MSGPHSSDTQSFKGEPGYDARALIEAADPGQGDTLFCLGGNLYTANPNLIQAKRALGNIDTIVYLATSSCGSVCLS